MSDKAEQERALSFLISIRGRYIISQALHKAIQVMEAVPAPHTEHSNIADMKYLREHLFNLPAELFDGSPDEAPVSGPANPRDS